MFPPFSLISRVLQKIQRERVQGIIIIPKWPTQTWWPVLMRMLIDNPVLLPNRKKLLFLPSSPEMIHPLYPKLELLMCHLSGDLLKAKEFQQKLQRSSCSPGDQAPQPSTKLTTRKGNHSAVDGTLIPFRPLKQDGINFLGDLFATGVGYSCINTAHSALSSIIVLPGSVHFGSHPLITRFVKGVFETRPSLPRYKEIWDVNSVLKILATWTLGVKLGLRDMSWKLTMLLALLSGQRVQTLKALSLSSMTLTANKCVFTIDMPLKTTRPGKHLSRIEFLAYEPDQNLCVVQHLQAYIDRTSH